MARVSARVSLTVAVAWAPGSALVPSRPVVLTGPEVRREVRGGGEEEPLAAVEGETGAGECVTGADSGAEGLLSSTKEGLVLDAS